MNRIDNQRPINSAAIYLPTVISDRLAARPLQAAIIALALLVISLTLSILAVTEPTNTYHASIPLLSWAWSIIAAYHLAHWLLAKSVP